MRAYGQAPQVTADVAGSDMAAIGVLNQARDFGLTVPQDLSIMAIDGTELCELVQPQLSSVSQSFYDMGVAGVEQLTTAQQQPPKITPITVVTRESVRFIES